MGREVTGVCVQHNNTPTKAKLNGADHDTNLNVSGVNTEAKDHQVNEAEKCEEKPAKLEDQNSSSPDKPAAGPATIENVQMKPSVLKPLDDEIGKHACVSPIVAKMPLSENCIPNDATSLTSEKKSESNSPSVPRTLLDEDDDWSLSSSTGASARTNKFKTTVAVAPTFKVDERLEKRKEFYEKLEEKHRALEAEKREYEARTKEEEEAKIKQMRKSMVVRANPVPSFYYEPPQPKKELKKLPTTRAKSPNIGRRKSFSDAMRSSSDLDKAACSRALRHSLGTHNKECSSPGSTPKKKDRTRDQNANGAQKVKEHQNHMKEVSQSMPKQTTTDIAIES